MFSNILDIDKLSRNFAAELIQMQGARKSLEVFPYFGGILHPVVSFIVSLSIIVFVHEYGHYIVGKWTGIKADVFSVGMGPVILSRVDKNGTTWQIAAIPFGGFVKFKGDANISSSRADLRSKALNKKRFANDFAWCATLGADCDSRSRTDI